MRPVDNAAVRLTLLGRPSLSAGVVTPFGASEKGSVPLFHGNGRSRELVVPFGGTGYIVLFEIIGNNVIVGAVRHQREEDYRH